MRELLGNSAFAKLFSAQIVALVGTGLLTVALGLLAFDLAGGDAGIVLGIALTIKMVAYVLLAPIMAALTHRMPRRTLLVGADVVRAAVALCLPLVGEVWQVYLLVFVLQAASATFTPAFQAVIPEIVPEERQYTRALSLSRLAYDLESLASPVIAALLLTVISFHELFVGTALGFVVSSCLVLATAFPAMRVAAPSGFLERVGRGAREFVRVPQLRALLALDVAVAAGAAMVIVNTVVLVQGVLGRTPTDVALLLACYGGGSMVVALALGRLLDRVSDRSVMLAGAALLPVGLLGAALVSARDDAIAWGAAFAVWTLLGVANSLVLTPSGRVLRRAAEERVRPAVFAAQFSLSHACFLVTYPLAGVVGAVIGLPAVALVLAVLAAGAAVVAARTWRVHATV